MRRNQIASHVAPRHNALFIVHLHPKKSVTWMMCIALERLVLKWA